jgi:hypothetical protein
MVGLKIGPSCPKQNSRPGALGQMAGEIAGGMTSEINSKFPIELYVEKFSNQILSYHSTFLSTCTTVFSNHIIFTISIKFYRFK